MRLWLLRPVVIPLLLSFTLAHGALAATRLLVDASKDGGTWWFPQGKEGFDPQKPHQGKALADRVRTIGWQVEELARGDTVTFEKLTAFDVVLRPRSSPAYSPAEVAAYASAINHGVRLVLLCPPSGLPDPIAQLFGLALEPSEHPGTPTHHLDRPAVRNAVAGNGPWGRIDRMPEGWIALASVTASNGAVHATAAYGRHGDGGVLCFCTSHMLIDPGDLAAALQAVVSPPALLMSDLRAARLVARPPSAPSATRPPCASARGMQAPPRRHVGQWLGAGCLAAAAVAAFVALWVFPQRKAKDVDHKGAVGANSQGIQTPHELRVALRYLWSYLIACGTGVLIYALLSGNWPSVFFLPLAPMVFPQAVAKVFGCYDVNPSPLQMVLAFGPYIVTVVLGIVTKRRIFYVGFVLILMVNIGGCAIFGVQDAGTRRSQRRVNSSVHPAGNPLGARFCGKVTSARVSCGSFAEKAIGDAAWAANDEGWNRI